jgi:acyl carrier protein
VYEQVMLALERSLNIPLPRDRFGPQSALLGAIPEFDSMAVVALLTNLEEQFGFVVEDDEVDGAVFATIGSLTKFVESKIAA